VTTWLELLLRDATPAEVEAHRSSLLETEEPEVVEAEARRALQLHALLRERSQRATELAALSDMAGRLTSVRDLPALLTDVARLARQLLRTDVAYLALVEQDVMRIKYFDGQLGPAFREIELSLSAGLAGRIVTTGRASWTSDYLSDPSFEHAPVADELAGSEQLRGILGVPLHAQGSTFGVLFVSERSARPFADHEVSLLAGLAGHAAVAIENARLFEAERLATQELRTSASGVARAVMLHERLTEAVVRGGGPADVVQALADVLGVPVQLLDAGDVPLVGPDLGGPQPSEHFRAGERRTVVLPGEPTLVLCPVAAADDYFGCLVVRGAGVADDAEVRLLERGALGIALALVQERALNEAAARTQGELLAALVEGGEPEVLERRAAAMRFDLRRPHVIALAESEDPGARAACAELARRSGGLVVDRGSRTLLLVPADVDLSGLARCATVGVSPPVVGGAHMPEALAAARTCLQALLALGRRRRVGGADSLGVYRFLLAPGGPDEAARFVQATAGALLDHDTERGTDLARTLEEYLASGRQHAATAERLHIHPNTLYQRLNRIGVVLGGSWREPDVALDLLVALRLHRLAAEL
jgi:GAF domain-containing protein